MSENKIKFKIHKNADQTNYIESHLNTFVFRPPNRDDIFKKQHMPYWMKILELPNDNWITYFIIDQIDS
jgi:hypothetical protein